MDSLYIIEPGSYLRKDGGALKVMQGKTVLDYVPADGLKRLMIVGYASLTGAVLDFLIANRVETVFITPTGRFRARLGIDEHRHVALRKAQYLNLSSSSFSLNASKSIVRGKIENMYAFLRLRSVQYQDKDLKITALKLKSMSRHTEKVEKMDVLRGLEGAATRVYFSVFPVLLRNPDFFFKGRNRRPPLDPVNAMLSFVYTLITNEVLSAIKTAGLDPYMGAFHEIRYGRPSLACDLMEEYRPFIGDRLVLGLINKKAVRPDDFIIRPDAPKTFSDEKDMKNKRPVEMKPGTLKIFIAAYEEMMNRSIFYPPLEKKLGLRWLVQNQVRQFGKALEDTKKGYEAFLWKN